MKPFKFIIAITFVFVTIASLTIFIGEKIGTDRTIPEIKIEDEIIEVSLKATDEELLKGVTAYDEKDKDLTDKIIIESISKFTEKGVSKVTYAVCDSNNNVAKATRKIKYKGYKSPKFKVTGNLCFSLYERIDIREFIHATDSLEGSITNDMIITSEDVSGSMAGAYTIKASVTNKKGDSSSIELPLIIEDRPILVPVIELKEYLVYAKKGSEIKFEDYIISAMDSDEKDLKKNVTIESTVDFNKAGTYNVHYYVTDSNDLRGHSVLTVVVGD